MSCLLLSDKVQIREDRLYPDLGRLLSNITTMIAAFAILALLITLGVPPAGARPKLTRRLAALFASITAMAALFAAASPLPQTLGDFGGLYRTRPELTGYIAIYIAFLGTALAELLILAWRYARLARHRRYLHAGLLLMAAGSALGLVYLAEKTIDHRRAARRDRRHTAGLGHRAGGPAAHLLLPYLDPAATDAARHAATTQGLHGDQLRATIRATELAAALDTHAGHT